MIRITAKRAGFRRCGIAHPAEPTSYPHRRFSAEELRRLKVEPMLKVEELEAAHVATRRKKATKKKPATKKSTS